MKLSFVKDGETITAFIVENGEKKDFVYDDMIKKMYDDKDVSDSEMEGNYTENEIDSIKKLTDELKSVLKIFNTSDEISTNV